MLRPYADILADLAKPLPPGCITQLTQGGQEIDFLHWYVVAAVLDHYAPGWTSAPIDIQQMSKKITVKVALTLRAKEGEFTQVATGYEDDWAEGKKGASYGDPLSNACAMAFKRAAVLFGVGRDLYDKDGALNALKASWGQGRAPGDMYQKVPPAATKPPTPPKHWHSVPEPAEDWHAHFAALSDACAVAGFQQARKDTWLRKRYGTMTDQWTTRDLTIAQMEDALALVTARQFTEEQDAWLRGLSLPRVETAPPREEAPLDESVTADETQEVML